MFIALIITWVCWGLLIAIEIYWRRVWVMWLAVPIVLSFCWLVVGVFSPKGALYLAVVFHLAIVVYALLGLIKNWSHKHG